MRWDLGRSHLNIGIYGQTGSSDGVMGSASGSGNGVHGKAPFGWAGYFEGKVLTTRFYEMAEIATPPAL